MTTMVRQTQDVYSAEQALAALIDRRDSYPILEIHGSRIVVPEDRKFADVDSMQRYVDTVLRLNWVRAEWPNARSVKVVAKRGNREAHYQWGSIHVPTSRQGRWAMRETVLLHELAHHLNRVTNPGSESHGPEFAHIFLTLVEELVGPEAGFILRANYLDSGIHF